MEICKSCLHHETCGVIILATAIKAINSRLANKCEYFTARSEWAHLPCKVGDKIYQTDGIRIYESTIREIEVSLKSTVYCTENIAFDERTIGKTVFFTREEAEKVLEGKK